MSTSWANQLSQVQKIAQHSMKANKVRLRVGSENMANAESAGYVPKEVILKHSYDLKSKVSMVKVKKIEKNAKRQKSVYQPGHPQADEKGYITMPDTNPLTELMNVQEAKHSYERGLKVYETATDLRHKGIALIAGR
jgi:flagellar basal-body rod protein FlgC